MIVKIYLTIKAITAIAFLATPWGHDQLGSLLMAMGG